MTWTKDRIHDAVNSQRDFFSSGQTLDVSWRIEQLKKLRDVVLAHEQELTDALHLDLGRHATEAYFCDIGVTVLEINEMIRGLRKWAKPERHFSGLCVFRACGRGFIKYPTA